MPSARNLALLIGMGTYEKDKVAFSDLPAPKNDVEMLRKVLTTGPHSIFLPGDVQSTIDMSSGDLAETIEKFVTRAEKLDFVLLYYSGHGRRDLMSNTLYLTATNTQADLLNSTALSIRVLRDILLQCRSQRAVIILDCCGSGSGGDDLVKGDDDNTIWQLTSSGPGRYVLASCGPLEESWIETAAEAEHGRRMSVFTRALVDGIETEAADEDEDGLVGLGEWFRYAARETNKRRPNQHPYRWVIGQQGEEIVVAHSSKSHTSWFESSEGAETYIPFTVGHISDTSGGDAYHNAYLYESMHLYSAWNLTDGRANCRVAIIGGHVEKHHPALKDVRVREISVEAGHGPPTSSAEVDQLSTGLAGLIAAHRHENSFIGVAPGVEIDAVVVANADGVTTTYAVSKAIARSVYEGARVICLPWQWMRSFAIARAVEYAAQSGVVVVRQAIGPKVGSGLTARESTPFAGNILPSDTVGRLMAGRHEAKRAYFAAPGGEVVSCGLHGKYQKLSGAPVACAFICGILCLMLSVNPKLDPINALRLLYSSSQARDEQRIVFADAYRAVFAASRLAKASSTS